MRILITAIALVFAMATSAVADDKALTQEQVQGVQETIRGMGCTVADSDIEIEGSGYEADDVICGDGDAMKKYDVYLDKDFKVIRKVDE